MTATPSSRPSGWCCARPGWRTSRRSPHFYASERARLRGRPDGRAARLEGVRRRRRRLGLRGFGRFGRSRRGRPAPISARSASTSRAHLSRARDRLDAAPAPRAAASPPRRRGRCAPGPTARSGWDTLVSYIDPATPLDPARRAARPRHDPAAAPLDDPGARLPPSRPGGARMTAAPRIETDRLVLRPHRMEDFAAIAAFFASERGRASSAGRCRAPRLVRLRRGRGRAGTSSASAPGRSRRRRPAPSPARSA